MKTKKDIQILFARLQDKVDQAKKENADWDMLILSRTFIQYELLSHILEVDISDLEANYKLL